MEFNRSKTTLRMGSLRYPDWSGDGSGEPLPSSKMSKPGPNEKGVFLVPVNPATSVVSVGGMWAWACARCLMIGSPGANFNEPSGVGNRKPSELSNGSPEGALKRPFHINAG